MNRFGRKRDICKSPFHLRVASDKPKANGSWQPKRVNVTSVGQEARPKPTQDCACTPEKRTPASEQFAAQTTVSINRVQTDTVGDPLLEAGHDVIGANVGCATGEMLKPLSNNNVAFNSELLEVGMDSIVSLFGECQAHVDECDDCSDVPVRKVQFDMERFVADSNVTVHYVDLSE